MTKRKVAYGVIPPEADAECVAHMEEVLETYAKPDTPNVPVVCMDEQPVQLLKRTSDSLQKMDMRSAHDESDLKEACL